MEGKNEKRIVKEIKVVLLGSSQVGKSSIILRFVKGKFFEYNESTVGVAFLQQTVPFNEKIRIKFDIWDTAGQERFGSLAPMYYRGAPAAIVVYDITSSETFLKAKHWIKELRLRGKPNVLIVLIGNKSDLEDQRKISTSEALEYSQQENLYFFCETSAKEGVNVVEVFKKIASGMKVKDLKDSIDEKVSSNETIVVNDHPQQQRYSNGGRGGGGGNGGTNGGNGGGCKC